MRARAKAFFDHYTQDLEPGDFQRLLTRDAPEAYRYFARGMSEDKLDTRPWYRRWPARARMVFSSFSQRLSPGRRVLYGFALASALLGILVLFRGVAAVDVSVFPVRLTLPMLHWVPGTQWLILAFVAINLLMLLEVADRLSLKGELEIARDIQLAMLPDGVQTVGNTVICGLTRPANTVGGDLFDVIPRPDGRVVIALGDVAGKGSPAALLMALLLAMMRTLVDEGLDSGRLVARLNAQIAKHSPASRFITLFFGVYDPRDGSLEYVNAGHLPPVVRRADGSFAQLDTSGGGIALGMFEESTYETERMTIEPGDVLVLYSDGITEAENEAGQPFDEAGLQALVSQHRDSEPQELGRAILRGVERHAGDAKLGDDLTALVLTRHADPVR